MRALRNAAAFVAVVSLAIGGVLATATPASADGYPTTIAFTDPAPIEVAFGDLWALSVSVTVQYPEGPSLALKQTDGTVDVYLSGIAGAYATGLKIQADGKAYLSQPGALPLLAAGSYDVSAVFNPAPGAYYAPAQTATPLKLTVSSLDVKPTVDVTTDLGVSEHPVITASLSGPYVDARGGAPAGTWAFTIKDGKGAAVFEAEVAQAEGGTDPIRIEVAKKLSKGGTYSVSSSFTPVPELAGGVVAAAISDSSFQTPGGGFGDQLAAGVPLPVWLAILLLVLILGLGVTAIVFGVRLAGASTGAGTDTAASAGAPRPSAGPQRIPGDPSNVELVSLEDMGLPDAQTIPELLPEGTETKKLPTSTTWLLSDVEPATSLPDSSEAPTERIDAVSAADVKTELIDTGETEAAAEPEATNEAPKPS